MILSILLGYIVFSYVVGLIVFLIEIQRPGNRGLINIGLILLALSPITAWHAIRHYILKYFHRNCVKR